MRQYGLFRYLSRAQPEAPDSQIQHGERCQRPEKPQSRKTDGSGEWNESGGIRLSEAEGNDEGATEQDASNQRRSRPGRTSKLLSVIATKMATSVSLQNAASKARFWFTGLRIT